MKKLLATLGTITIAGSGMAGLVGNAPTRAKNEINYQQTNNLETLNRVKRENNNFSGNEFQFIEKYLGRKTYILTVIPNTFEELIFLKLNNNFENFKSKFCEMIWNNFSKKISVPGATLSYNAVIKVSRPIFDSFSEINNYWQNSGKRSKIKINLVSDYHFLALNEYEPPLLEKVEILESQENNKYLEKLWTDFNSDLSKEYIDLGVIEDKNDNFILNKLKEKYSKLNISYFEVFEKKDYSFFDKSFSTKFKIKSNNELIYPIQTLNYKFTFITKKWLNEDLPKLIDNENLIQNWKSNFINWQNEINRQINEDLSKYGNDERGRALKRTWKGNNINEIKNKLLSLNHILETIDSKFKLNELYNKVQNLEKDINELKSQINKLNQKISEIQNSLNKNEDLENCANIAGTISASTGWIPYIGTLISTVSGTVASICTVINA